MLESHTGHGTLHSRLGSSAAGKTKGGKLFEIPFGVKDIIETRGLATEYGSPIYKGRIGTADAAIVREMRRRGAILLGKTHCTPFAYFTPAPTRNPRDLEHTPGGSSSGSAAAIAAGWCGSLSEPKPRGRCCGQLPIVALPDSRPAMVFFPWRAYSPLAKSLDTL